MNTELLYRTLTVKSKTRIVVQFLLFGWFLISVIYAQERVLYRLSGNGGQEAIPIQKNETIQAALQRISKEQLTSFETATGSIQKIKSYDSTVSGSNFGFNHQDVQFIWFNAEAGGTVKSIVWHNYGLTGDIGKATIRAWKVDSRVATIPVTAGAGGSNSAMGYYLDAADGDGGVTAFKNNATDTTFKPALGNPDSAAVSFDPLGREAAWRPNGLQVTLNSAQWQSIDLLSWGDSLNFSQGELFGFTLQNDSPPGGADARMEMWAYANTATPFHSYKFYETDLSRPKGWHIRGDFEWQMYVIVEYTTDTPPKINNLQQLKTAFNTNPRTVSANITDDNPTGGTKGVASVNLYAKINSGGWTQSAMTGTEPNYTGTLPTANPGDTVFYYVTATDVNNTVSNPSLTYSYTIFKITNNILCLYNGRSIPSGKTVASMIPSYMLKDSLTEERFYDVWDVKINGITEIPQLLTHYQIVNEVTGDGGFADLTSMAGVFLSG